MIKETNWWTQVYQKLFRVFITVIVRKKNINSTIVSRSMISADLQRNHVNYGVVSQLDSLSETWKKKSEQNCDRKSVSFTYFLNFLQTSIAFLKESTLIILKKPLVILFYILFSPHSYYEDKELLRKTFQLMKIQLWIVSKNLWNESTLLGCQK